MRWRALAIVALVLAAAVAVGPSAAFNYTTMSRSASAAIVTTANGYNALTIVTCNGNALSSSVCSSNLVTNKGAAGQQYRLTEEDDAGKVSSQGIDGGGTVTSGATGWTAEKSVGQSAALNLHLVACGTLTGCASTKTYTSYWTVEGQKANTLEFTTTRVAIVIQYP